MSIALWSLLLGFLLITMVLGGTLLARLLLSSAMVYLFVGYTLGPAGLAVITLNPAHHADVLAWVAEVAVLISLFNVGLKMGAVPFSDRRWRVPLCCWEASLPQQTLCWLPGCKLTVKSIQIACVSAFPEKVA